MTWIRSVLPTDPEHAVFAARRREVNEGYPPEYGPPRPGNKLPPAVASESIVASHGLIPEMMFHMFAGFRAMLVRELPLTRREHELIATVVSHENECFY